MRAGWSLVPLRSVCAIEREQGTFCDLPYVGLEDIESGSGKLIGPLEPREVKSSTFRFGNRHVLYGRLRPYLRKVVTPQFDGHCSTELFPLRPSAALFREYLRYWLLSDDVTRQIDATANGARMPRADMNEVMAFDFPLPPVGEQQRVVTILDEAFAGIAAVELNARGGIESARAAFDAQLEDLFVRGRNDWVETCVGEVGRTQTGSTPKSSSAGCYGDFMPFIKPSDFNPDGSLDYGASGLSEQGYATARVVPSGAALMVCIGATIGKCGYTDRDVTTNQQINALIPYEGLSARFLYFQMLTRGFQEKVRENAGQATLPIINKTKWGLLPVVVPPLEMQESIVSALEAIRVETRRLESIYRRKLAALEELKQSLLHRAFSGQL